MCSLGGIKRLGAGSEGNENVKLCHSEGLSLLPFVENSFFNVRPGLVDLSVLSPRDTCCSGTIIFTLVEPVFLDSFVNLFHASVDP